MIAFAVQLVLASWLNSVVGGLHHVVGRGGVCEVCNPIIHVAQFPSFQTGKDHPPPFVDVAFFTRNQLEEVVVTNVELRRDKTRAQTEHE